jgi:hypothetical protein
MQAMMSDRAGREALAGQCVGEVAYDAEREAARILAETEPEQDGPALYTAHAGCFGPKAGVFCAVCLPAGHRADLADSLRAVLPVLAALEAEARNA